MRTKRRPAKSDKRDMRMHMRLTRPPRLEGAAKEARMQPLKKPASDKQ